MEILTFAQGNTRETSDWWWNEGILTLRIREIFDIPTKWLVVSHVS